MDHSSQFHKPASAPAQAGVGTWLVRLVLALLSCLVLLITVVALAVALIDWNRAKPWVNERVSDATGRHFQIQGNLDAQWIWPQPMDSGWRHWVPGVFVNATDIELGNLPEFGPFGALSPLDQRDKPPLLTAPTSASTDAGDSSVEKETAAGESAANTPYLMARVDEARATLRLLPLLGRMLLIDNLELLKPDVALGRAKNGDNNWTFPTRRQDAPKPNPWDVNVAQLVLANGQIAYADVRQTLAVRAVIDSISPTDEAARADDASQGDAKTANAMPYGLSVKLNGSYRDATLKGQGRAGQLLSLRQAELLYPIEFDLSAGSTSAKVAGTLSNPRKLNGIDMMVTLGSSSMSDLYDVTGLVLPRTPPFKTSGHLIGSLEPERATWDYENFSGVVGKSDLQGHLTYTSGSTKPKLTGRIKSRKLQLADLGPVVGTPEGAGANKQKTTRAGKVLPDTTFDIGRWDAMDMDIAFLGQKLIGPSALPLDDMSARAILNDGVLKLDPLRFGVAKGKIDAKVELDGKAKPLNGTIRATVDDLQLSALFPKVELLEKSFGRMDGAFALSGQGASIATLLAKSNGELRVYIRDGTFSKQMLDLAALNLGSVIVTKLFGPDEEVKLRCAVADFGVKNGIAQTRSVKLSTNEAVVEAVGTLDFGHEHMDFRIKPESLEWKFLSLRTPLHVRGPFIKPEVSIEAAPLLARAGAAIVAAAVAPAALALVPITVPGVEDDEECAKLLAKADQAVKAGPAGAKARP